MELRAFAICRGCFEVHRAPGVCPHCDGAVAPAPNPAPAPLDELPLEPATTQTSLWGPGLAVAGLAVVLLLLLVAAASAA